MKTIKKSTKLLCLSLVMALVLSVFAPTTAIEAQAAKKVTTNYNIKKAPSVKVGTTTVTSKPYKYANYKKNLSSVGYVKFKVPKTATYQFTISNVAKKGDSKSYANGAVSFRTSTGTSLKVKTEGGKAYTLWVRSAANYTQNGKVTTSAFIPKRTATIKLKKGQIIYINFNNISTNTYSLKIKKK